MKDSTTIKRISEMSWREALDTMLRMMTVPPSPVSEYHREIVELMILGSIAESLEKITEVLETIDKDIYTLL